MKGQETREEKIVARIAEIYNEGQDEFEMMIRREGYILGDQYVGIYNCSTSDLEKTFKIGFDGICAFLINREYGFFEVLGQWRIDNYLDSQPYAEWVQYYVQEDLKGFACATDKWDWLEENL